MVRGAPDYSAVFAEVLGARAYTDYTLNATGLAAAGSYVSVDLGTVLEGYEVYQAVGIASARGCDTVHGLELYINATLKRTSYFEVEAIVFYPRHYVARAGEVMTAIFYNYDAVARYFAWSGIGVYQTIGSPKPSPKSHPGEPPVVGEDEQLWLVEDTLLGAHWSKAKQRPIEKTPKRVREFLEGIGRGG